MRVAFPELYEHSIKKDLLNKARSRQQGFISRPGYSPGRSPASNEQRAIERIDQFRKQLGLGD